MNEGSDQGDAGAAERGRPAHVQPNGEVHGSGAGAGGGGTSEDFDADAVAGDAGNLQPRHPVPADKGGDAPSHNSR